MREGHSMVEGNMHTERKVIRKKPNELFMFDTFFKKRTGIELEDLPEEHKAHVLEAQKMIKDKAEIVIIYKCENVDMLTEDAVILESGAKYTGEMAAQIFKDAKQIVTCLVVLQGFEAIKAENDNSEVARFLDAWGSTYVESAQAWLGNYLHCELESAGKKRTHLWSPGQQKLDLCNQQTVFEILHPEEEGYSLTEDYVVTLEKAKSGIWGVLDKDATEQLLPCDFCELESKCPLVNMGCAET